MHPEIARNLAAQHRDELMQHFAPASHRSERRRWLPRWHVSWTRTVLAPAGGAPVRGNQHGSSVVIIISAHRSA
jgi:hypothetical protein